MWLLPFNPQHSWNFLLLWKILNIRKIWVKHGTFFFFFFGGGSVCFRSPEDLDTESTSRSKNGGLLQQKISAHILESKPFDLEYRALSTRPCHVFTQHPRLIWTGGVKGCFCHLLTRPRRCNFVILLWALLRSTSERMSSSESCRWNVFLFFL